jgi:hypothetical protein
MANRLWDGTVKVPFGSYLSQTSRNSSSCSMVIFLVSEPTLAKFSKITPMASDMTMYAYDDEVAMAGREHSVTLILG